MRHTKERATACEFSLLYAVDFFFLISIFNCLIGVVMEEESLPVANIGNLVVEEEKIARNPKTRSGMGQLEGTTYFGVVAT